MKFTRVIVCVVCSYGIVGPKSALGQQKILPEVFVNLAGHFSDDASGPMLSRLPTFNVILKNPHQVKMRVTSIVLELSDVKNRHPTTLIPDISPFLDRMVLKVSNVGGGSVDKCTFATYLPDTWVDSSSPGRAQLAGGMDVTLGKLLRADPVKSSLDADSIKSFFLPLRDVEAPPFLFDYNYPLSVRSEFRGNTRELLQTTNIKTASAMQAFRRPIESPPADFEGNVMFSGTVEGPGIKKQRMRYLARKLQRAPLSERELFMSRVLDARISGGLYEQWGLWFGKLHYALVWEQMEMTRIGFDVEIKDRNEIVTVKVPNLVVPEKDVNGPGIAEFSMRFLAQRSCAAKVKVRYNYSYDNGGAASQALATPIEVTVDVAGRISVGWEQTDALVKQLVSIEPTAIAKVKNLLKRGVPSHGSNVASDVPSCTPATSEQARQFADAVTVMFSIDRRDPDLSRAITQVVGYLRESNRRRAQSAPHDDRPLPPPVPLPVPKNDVARPGSKEGEFADSLPNDMPDVQFGTSRNSMRHGSVGLPLELFKDLFPIVFAISPAQAVDLAVEWYVGGDPRLMEIGLCFDGFATSAKRHSNRLGSVAGKYVKDGNWLNCDIAIGTLYGDSNVVESIKKVQGLNRGSALATVIVATSSVGRDRRFDDLIARNLGSGKLAPDSAELSIEALRLSGNSDLSNDVEKYARRWKNESSQIEGLLAALRYFRNNPRLGLQEFMVELTGHPNQSVRDAATSVLELVRRR